jgi:hypothetical protein
MKEKYYFQNKDDEFCYDTAYFQEFMEEAGLQQMEVFRAIPEAIPGYFWCMQLKCRGEMGFCGKICPDYKPRNGKNGICKHHSNIFFECGEKVTLKLKN